jgi:hypothetical protein
MRILVAGAWKWPWYELACSDAFLSLGHEVRRFSWAERFERSTENRVEPLSLSRVANWQNRTLWGPKVFVLNRDLLESVKSFRPRILFAYRPTHIFPGTLRSLKRVSPQTVLVEYCNDDPFSPNASRILWRHLLKAISIYDVHFVFRSHNITDFMNAGAMHAGLLRAYYVPDLHYPIQLKESEYRFRCDVVFAGHYEPDWRVDCLESVKQNGFRVNLFGGGWSEAKRCSTPAISLQELYPVFSVVGEDYRKALSGAKIALCFLSKLNRDTYTTRNFEIPAIGTFMLSEYSSDLATLFEEGREAEYFRSKDELIDKIQFYLVHDTEREIIARRGHERVLRDGHDVLSRMRQMLNSISELTGGKCNG